MAAILAWRPPRAIAILASHEYFSPSHRKSLVVALLLTRSGCWAVFRSFP